MCAVANGSVCDRVAREKSSKRSRRTTVRADALRRAQPARDAIDERRRAPRRPPRPSSASARAHAARRSSRAGGRLAPAAGRDCARARAGAGRPRGRAATTSASSPSRATWPTVAIPRARSFRDVTGPTPQSRSTASGCRNASSRSGGTTSRPSGFATPLATLARNFVRATPTVIGSPTRSSTLRFSRTRDLGRRRRRAARIPRTSRNASSIERPSTNGVVSSNTRYTALLASE